MNIQHVKFPGPKLYRFIARWDTHCHVCGTNVPKGDCIVGLAHFRSHKECEGELQGKYDAYRETCRANGRARRKLTMEQACEARSLSAEGEDISRLADKFGVSYTLMACLLRGETYREA